jgi:hypothetical protein
MIKITKAIKKSNNFEKTLVKGIKILGKYTFFIKLELLTILCEEFETTEEKYDQGKIAEKVKMA